MGNKIKIIREVHFDPLTGERVFFDVQVENKVEETLLDYGVITQEQADLKKAERNSKEN